MSLTFYFAPMSTASITMAVLAELGVDHESIQVDLGEDGTRSAEFLSINPNGMVPTIVHEGVAIWESTAITMYLGETFGVGAGVYPAPGTKRGEAMKWIAWSGAGLFVAAGRFASALSPELDGAVEEGAAEFEAAADRSPAALESAKADIASKLAIADAALAGRDFLVGEYSLADTHLHAIVGWLAMMGIDLAATPRLQAWVQRCDARPALAALNVGPADKS